LLLKFLLKLRLFLLVDRIEKLLILIRVFPVDYSVIVVGKMTIIDHSKVMEHCGHHLVVALGLPQGDFELDFHLLIGHLFADEETQPNNHVVESLLGPDDFLELRILKKSLSPVHQPLRGAF
jgi:hypothetical protein